MRRCNYYIEIECSNIIMILIYMFRYIFVMQLFLIVKINIIFVTLNSGVGRVRNFPN
ncbi:hypothetical protein M2132_002342 [Dysgonomonas sp. PH5-45]|nr:hypothetical protein [Dysgonomonas sp. PH5-45]MDH6388886.1 hypothetical protein [Dysgonomonas sp. PH5-37]